MNLNQLFRESFSKPNGGVRTVEIDAHAYRIQAGIGDIFENVPVTVAIVTHADKRGRPLAWSVTRDEQIRSAAIKALEDEERVQTMAFAPVRVPS